MISCGMTNDGDGNEIPPETTMTTYQGRAALLTSRRIRQQEIHLRQAENGKWLLLRLIHGKSRMRRLLTAGTTPSYLTTMRRGGLAKTPLA
ncbi:hypothetical protein CONLIGDRAFT_244264 [Coniochaeta ligniaria NRRL 30616]|uniref:Uncharacterized protein n=1 Tax=Coniochaeta ligniaria NRRL 30616 TaxID=1408157 RepID=A0A1J7JEW5_9PEZI|nr:hypothetical protein CONLIGDRAFT_244264 [Coniochaeta ligniaria NRRL 30616]